MFKYIIYPVLRNGFYLMSKESFDDYMQDATDVEMTISLFNLQIVETKRFFLITMIDRDKYDHDAIKKRLKDFSITKQI